MLFKEEVRLLTQALKSVDDTHFKRLVVSCCDTVRKGGKIVVSGLGKNVPLCEKFVGTMISMGLPAAFMHTNSAIHGDLGMVKSGDLVIILSKSGNTAESIHLHNLLCKRDVDIWLLSFAADSALAEAVENKILVDMEHEGDLWNIVPNNSSVLNLIILQKLCMAMAERLEVSLDDFRQNHPGGHIGQVLSCQKN